MPEEEQVEAGPSAPKQETAAKTDKVQLSENLRKILAIDGPLVAAIDQGTSSTRFLIFSPKSPEPVVMSQMELSKIFPQEGWVEHDPMLILESVRWTMADGFSKLKGVGVHVSRVKCIGICNQRESCIVWDRETGKPYYNSIVWLDNRATDIVDHYLDQIPNRDKNYHKSKTGLPISTYFSALKLRWLMENKPEIKKAIDDDRLLFGTVDSWILYNLIGKHLTDVTNASRTFLYDIVNMRWSETMSKFFDIPLHIMPEVKPSGHYFGEILDGPFKGVPITAVVGDQSAALVGQNCVTVGATKATFGTGGFILQNIGSGTMRDAMRGVPHEAKVSLITTIGYQLKDQLPVYALEGSVAAAGAAVTWMRDNLSIIDHYDEIRGLTDSVPDSGGVLFVPAFQGLYAPYWDATAAGILVGLSGFSTKAHVMRATLDAIAYQVVDILELMRQDDTGIRIDGGMCCNNLLGQILADMTGCDIIRPQYIEATAMGVSMIAGNTIGIWDITGPEVPAPPPPPPPPEPELPQRGRSRSFMDALSDNNPFTRPRLRNIPDGADVFSPAIDEEEREDRMARWHEAIDRSMRWNKTKKLEEKRGEYLRRAVMPSGFFMLLTIGIIILSTRT